MAKVKIERMVEEHEETICDLCSEVSTASDVCALCKRDVCYTHMSEFRYTHNPITGRNVQNDYDDYVICEDCSKVASPFFDKSDLIRKGHKTQLTALEAQCIYACKKALGINEDREIL